MSVMARDLFVDLDGVLFDMDRHYFECFGKRLAREDPDPPDLWTNLQGHGSFYRTMPLKADARELWTGLLQIHPAPTILTGVPLRVPRAALHKAEAVAEHFGEVRFIACRSADKCKYGRPGDVLIDDWVKYRHLWENMGGIFLLHTSAAETLPLLRAVYAD